jgi:hypothetical protein
MVYGCFAVNKARVQHKRLYVYGGVSLLQDIFATISHGETPRLACFNAEGSKKLDVPSITPALIRTLQVLETIQCITGKRSSLSGKLKLTKCVIGDFPINRISTFQNKIALRRKKDQITTMLPKPPLSLVPRRKMCFVWNISAEQCYTSNVVFAEYLPYRQARKIRSAVRNHIMRILI